jgi:hypothetical protein
LFFFVFLFFCCVSFLLCFVFFCYFPSLVFSQGINSVRGIKYENVDATARLGIANCGAACGGGHVTMSSRIYSVFDFDGTMSRSSGPSILGSHETWWNHEALGCVYRSELLVWVCPWKERSTVAYIEPGVDGLYDGCDAAITALVDPAEQCTDQYAPYTVGRMSQWGGAAGAAKNLELGAWRGTSGMANTGKQVRQVQGSLSVLWNGFAHSLFSFSYAVSSL